MISPHTALRARCLPSVVALAIFALLGPIAGLASGATASNDSDPAHAVDLFDAMAAGDIEVKLIVKNMQEAKIVARNMTKKPLTIKVPEAFAAVPVLAQQQGGGGFGGGGQGGQGGQGGGGFFNVPPEKVAKHDVGFICLEHGKPDPRSTMQYELKPIESQTTNPKVIELLKQIARGRYGQQAGQAAAWHLENGLSWQTLASKQRRHAHGVSEPYFAPQVVRQAMKIVEDITRIVD